MTVLFSTSLPTVRKEDRKLYTKLRAIANKRLSRLRNSEFSNSQIAVQFDRDFISIYEMKNEQSFYFALKEVQRFLEMKTSTLTGARERITGTIATLNARGIHVKRTDLRKYGMFLNALKASLPSGTYYADQVEDLWNSLSNEEKNLPVSKLMNLFNTRYGKVIHDRANKRSESAKRGIDYGRLRDLFHNG